MLSLLMAAALVLTFLMFFTRNSMLGFPCGIFWALEGGRAYDLSDATWDIYYLLFFSAMGMVIFCIYSAFTLRRRDLSPSDKDWDDSDEYHDEQKMIDSRRNDKYNSTYMKKDGERYMDSHPHISKRARELHQRADRRRLEGVQKKDKGWGEFK